MSGLVVTGLDVHLGQGAERLRAVSGVSLVIAPGETLGLVGESGSGKSTVARAVAGLVRPTSGTVHVDGRAIAGGSPSIQMVFQDPYSSLNPRLTIAQMLAEAVGAAVRRNVQRREVGQLLDMVALPTELGGRYPHELSGGQRQRAAIARALSAQPRVLLLDEVTSALDVSVQAALLKTLKELQAELDFACLFISHDLAVVRQMSSRVAVMYLSRIVETAPARDLFAAPQHPYTRVLLSSVAGNHARSSKAIGEMPDPRQPPAGCTFHTRCPAGPAVRADRGVCISSDPYADADRHLHRAACHFAPAAQPLEDA